MKSPPTPAGDRLVAATESESSSVESRRFSARVAWTLATRVLMAANNLVAGIIVARWLGADGLGVFAVLSVAIIVVVQVACLGLPAANVYFIARDRRLTPTAAVNSLVFALIAGGALALSIIALMNFRPDWFGQIPLGVAMIAAAQIPFHLVAFLGVNMMLAIDRPGRFNLMETLNQSFVVVNTVITLIVIGGGLQLLFSLNLLASILVNLVLIEVIRHHCLEAGERVKWRPDFKLFRRMMGYSVKFHVTHVASLVVFRADLLIVHLLRGATEAGIYSVAAQGSLVLMLLPNAIGMMLFPRVAGEQDARGEFTCRLARATAFVMLLACVAAVPFSFALPLLYGTSFIEATMQFLLLLPGVFLISLELIFVQHFTGTGLPIAVPAFWTLTLIVFGALLFALVPTFGGRGAAIASSVGYALIFALIAVYFRLKTGRTFNEMFVLRRTELRSLFDFRRLTDFRARRV